jgi:hypothetical protein
MGLVNFLIPKTADLDIHYLCQFTTEIVDVNTRAPINVRGVLVRQKEDFHPGIKDRTRREGKLKTRRRRHKESCEAHLRLT